MKTSRLFHRWHRCYSKLFDRQWSLLRETRETGSAEHVHELRIALRRVRLMMRVAAPLLDEPATRRYRSWSRKILNGTSRLRDYDVAVEWLGTRRTGAGAVRWIERQRHRLWRTARVRMTGLPAKLCSRLSRFRLNHRQKVRLEKRFCRQQDRLQESVLRQISEIPALDPEQKHEVRRKLRRIRYLLEIDLPHRKQTSDRLLKRVGRLQTAMGELQNITNTRLIFSRVPARNMPASLRTLLSREKVIRTREVLRHSHALRRYLDGPSTPPVLATALGTPASTRESGT